MDSLAALSVPPVQNKNLVPQPALKEDLYIDNKICNLIVVLL